MKTSVTVQTKLGEWSQKYRGALTQLYLFVAAQMQTNRGMLFMHSGVYNGHEKWAPLKLRAGQPLKDRGTLSQSIGPIQRKNSGVQPRYEKGSIVRFGGDKVTVGTNLKYARLMNDGGTIVPKNGKLLWIPLPQGNKATEEVKSLTKGQRKGTTKSSGHAPIVRLKNGKFFMLAKKVVVPPRNFEKWNQSDKRELEIALTNEVARVLNRA